jgi:hypothetical protein
MSTSAELIRQNRVCMQSMAVNEQSQSVAGIPKNR